jgi:hypothetical protein
VVREVSWSVIPLVAGLFVIVEALKDAGTLQIAQTGLEMVSRWPVFRGDLTGAFRCRFHFECDEQFTGRVHWRQSA